MNFDIKHEGRTTLAVNYADAIGLGYPVAAVGAALKAAAKQEIKGFADLYRSKLASASAGKLAEYRIKEEIARDPSAASEAELALLSREAKARGTTRAALIGQLKVRAAAYRQVALLIGALEAEAGAAITAIPDDANDIETKVNHTLSAAKLQADAAFSEVQAMLSA